MKLTLHSDYSLRVLLYLAHSPDRLVGTEEIASAYGISKHHLVRVVQTLAEHGYVEVKTGRSGGAKLAKQPQEINLGEVVRHTEQSFRMVECFDPATNTCPIVEICGLHTKLGEALEAFFAVLDRFTLADITPTSDRDQFFQIMGAKTTP